MGNILFLSGVMLTIGLKSTMQFFMKRQNYKGTISFGLGFFLVLIGWPIMGMILEAYGFIVLFSGFWPTLAVFLQRIPILGWIFQQPFVTSILLTDGKLLYGSLLSDCSWIGTGVEGCLSEDAESTTTETTLTLTGHVRYKSGSDPMS
ncbi:Vesicle transport protein [Macleaya cordata]|uniref:Vesicle transport protein n=1 Tax=Macleaya cordata TaxID=56857 RepID=A0A200QTE9_MACCD|nr:Vesicle transport protein [Macleaya cordata]